MSKEPVVLVLTTEVRMTTEPSCSPDSSHMAEKKEKEREEGRVCTAREQTQNTT